MLPRRAGVMFAPQDHRPTDRLAGWLAGSLPCSSCRRKASTKKRSRFLLRASGACVLACFDVCACLLACLLACLPRPFVLGQARRFPNARLPLPPRDPRRKDLARRERGEDRREARQGEGCRGCEVDFAAPLSRAKKKKKKKPRRYSGPLESPPSLVVQE